jgi:hypothetical protein
VIAVLNCHRYLKEPAQEEDLKANLIAIATPDKVSKNGGGPTLLEFNENTAKLRKNLILGLDYFTEAGTKSSTRRFPKCVKPFKENEEIGVIFCDDDQSRYWPLYAGMVDQDCYTRINSVPIVAKETIVFKSCRRLLVLLHQFNPSLRLDVEKKE